MLTISYSYFSLQQLHELATNLGELVNEAHGDDGMLRAATERIEHQLKVAQQMMADSQQFDLTSALAEADQRRDDGFMALRDTIAACLRRLNPEVRRGAERLFPVFGRNDAQLHVLPYSEQTAAMDNLFTDLEIDQFRKDLERVGAVPALNELKEAQKHFVEMHEASLRPEDESEQADQQVRSELKGALEVLISVLNTLTALNKVDGITETTGQISALIAQATQEAKSTN